MTFKEFVKHEHGTYVSLTPSPESAKRLDDWVRDNLTLSNTVPRKDLHTTLVYSRTPVPAVESYPFRFPIVGTIVGWKLLGDDNNKFLVAHVLSSELQALYADMKMLGCTSDYPEYIPHITVVYDYKGELPDACPRGMHVTYSSVHIDGLKENWRPA
jgi:hypothetical protein